MLISVSNHQRMSRKSVQRFCDNDTRQSKELKRQERIWKIAMRFREAVAGKRTAPRWKFAWVCIE
ncbi:hypothetical protein ASD54_25160 [Rhizobium sp. Root149]|nr:hypothetical protein ASD54_25160 [Rhizobium sp. Root149]